MTRRHHWNPQEASYTNRHPLFPIATHPVEYVLEAVGFSQLTAVRLLVCASAAIWSFLLVCVLGLSGCSPLIAALFGAVGIAGSGFLFWFAVPETFPFSAVTLLVALFVAAASSRRRLPEAAYGIASMATLSINSSLWVAGWLAALGSLPWRRAVQVSVNAFFAVTVLWGVQRLLYPDVEFILEPSDELEFIHRPTPLRVGQVTRAVLVHSAISPELQLCDRALPDWALPGARDYSLSVQESGIATGGLLSVPATAAWLALLGLGGWALFAGSIPRQMRFVLSGMVAWQMLLALVFGGETFLFAAHFWTLLVLVASLSVGGPAPRTALVSAIIFVTCAFPVNVAQLQRAASFYTAQPAHFQLGSAPCQQ